MAIADGTYGFGFWRLSFVQRDPCLIIVLPVAFIALQFHLLLGHIKECGQDASYIHILCVVGAPRLLLLVDTEVGY
ncbi:hypothetical protein F5882DRAFT_416683 [Hyaloscypha sp. PMI_1271]|nr:hypothetical protein F5882DRAFT_416683 [Hyaloscypha sp. PMI_1271]